MSKCDQCENPYLKGIHTCEERRPRNDAIAIVKEGKIIAELDLNLMKHQVEELNTFLKSHGLLPFASLKFVEYRKYDFPKEEPYNPPKRRTK